MKKRKLNAQQREAQAAWEKLKSEHAKPLERGARAKSVTKRYSVQSKKPLLVIDSDRDHSHIKSVDSGQGHATIRQAQIYSGDKMLGLSQMHKSNLVPVFNTESVIDISKMRR